MQVAIGLCLCVILIARILWVKFVEDRWWPIVPTICLLPALVYTAYEVRWQSFESGLVVAAAPVLGPTKAEFGCERLTRNFFASRGLPGHVLFDKSGKPQSEAFLSAQTCAGIADFQANPQAPDLAAIMAVHVMTHEAVHLTGIRNEGITECLALQADVLVMMRLGATRAAAHAAAQRYREEIYPRLHAEYRRASCPAANFEQWQQDNLPAIKRVSSQL